MGKKAARLHPRARAHACQQPKKNRDTMVENGKKHKINSHLLIHRPTSEGVSKVSEWAKWASEQTSERSGGRERSEHSGASERVSSVSERGNGRASGLVITSGFLNILNHSVVEHFEISRSSGDEGAERLSKTANQSNCRLRAGNCVDPVRLRQE